MVIVAFSAVIIAWLIWLAARLRTLNTQRRIGYRAWYRRYYLASPSWRLARALRLAFSRRRCAVCGAGGALDVHHRTYTIGGASVLYWEWLLWPFILQPLCRRCHDAEHGEVR